MKMKLIILGAVFVMLMLTITPSISAVQYTTEKTMTLQQLRSMNVDDLKTLIKEKFTGNDGIISAGLTLLLYLGIGLVSIVTIILYILFYIIV